MDLPVDEPWVQAAHLAALMREVSRWNWDFGPAAATAQRLADAVYVDASCKELVDLMRELDDHIPWDGGPESPADWLRSLQYGHRPGQSVWDLLGVARRVFVELRSSMYPAGPPEIDEWAA